MTDTTDLTTDPTSRSTEPTAAMDRQPTSPGCSARVPRLGIWAWSFVGFVVAAIIVVHRARRGQRDRAADDVRGRAGRVLQAAGRQVSNATTQAHAWPRA